MNIRFTIDDKSLETVKVFNSSNGHVANIFFKKGDKPMLSSTGNLGLEMDWVAQINKFSTQYDREIQGFASRMHKICSTFGQSKPRSTTVTV